MKKVMILILICFGMIQVISASTYKGDEESFIKLMDHLSEALVKQDKAWLDANLSEECSLSEPSGQTFVKSDIIKAFSPEGIYSLSQMKPARMKYIINESEASGIGTIDIEGTLSAGEVIDVSGIYNIETSFKKTDSGWKISAIKVSQIGGS